MHVETKRIARSVPPPAFAIVACLGLLPVISCGGTREPQVAPTPATAPSPAAEPEPVAEPAPTGETAAPRASELDWSAVGARRLEERRQRGDVLVVEFLGEFESADLPSEPTRAIPLDPFDARFLVGVRVLEVLAGALPEGYGERVVFAVHSPSIFFGVRGLAVPEGKSHPAGRHRFRLWRAAPRQNFEVDVEPAEPGGVPRPR